MIVCILVKDVDVENTREIVRQELPEFAKHQGILSIPLSETGLKPITHWLCTFDSDENMLNKVKSIQNKETTEIIEMEPKPFLASKNLKIVDRKKKEPLK